MWDDGYADVIPTEREPENDWHGTVSEANGVTHRAFVSKEETERWVYQEVKLRGVGVKGTIASASVCHFCKRN